MAHPPGALEGTVGKLGPAEPLSHQVVSGPLLQGSQTTYLESRGSQRKETESASLLKARPRLLHHTLLVRLAAGQPAFKGRVQESTLRWQECQSTHGHLESATSFVQYCLEPGHLHSNPTFQLCDLSKLLNFSVPRFSHLQKGDNITIYLIR